tara:strand:+ start:508 stop:1335 length:828 start_codon:yes stop_codon:yes gene_type:complete
MLLTGLCFVAVMVSVKFLSKDLPPTQAVFFRYLFGLILILPLIRLQFKKSIKKIPILKHGLRGVVHGLAVVLWFFSVANIPMADVTAINYLTPIFTTIGAILIFKEAITFNRIFALILSVIGAMLILKPGYEVLSNGKIAQLLSTIFFAISYLIAKNLTKTESTHSIVIFLTLFATITLLPFTLLIWTKPIMSDLLLLLGVAILGTLGHYFMTIALSLAPLSITQPVIFFQLIWSTLIGLLLFDESLDFFILIGGALIVIAIVRLSANENLHVKK